MKIKYIIYLFLTVMLTGCFTDFEPDIESKPVVCINANAKVGEEFIINVTHTWRWSEEDKFASHDITDAQVILYVNDEEYERPEYTTWELEYPDYNTYPPSTTKSGYCTSYIPQPGDKIKIMVHSVDYGDAEGEVTVPYPVAIDDVKIHSQIDLRKYDEYTFYEGNSLLKVSFTDPADITNYYMVSGGLNWGETSFGGDMAHLRYDADPIFTEHVSSLESAISETYGYTIFSDRQIAGKTYPLHIRVDDIHYGIMNDLGFESNGSYISLSLNSISESYYRHVISVWESNDGINGILGDVGLADPVWECSNVSSGAGVISAIAPSTIRIPFSKIVVETK